MVHGCLITGVSLSYSHIWPVHEEIHDTSEKEAEFRCIKGKTCKEGCMTSSFITFGYICIKSNLPAGATSIYFI